MFVHPQFDPVALQLGPLAVRWYGLMYLIAFGLVWILGRWRIARRPGDVWKTKDLDDALFYGVLGTILGDRLGYVLFYKLDEYFVIGRHQKFLFRTGEALFDPNSLRGDTRGVLAEARAVDLTHGCQDRQKYSTNRCTSDRLDAIASS